MGRFDRTKEEYDRNDAESGTYFKLADGQKMLVAFLGNPHNRSVYWDGSTYQPWTPDCGKPKSLKTSMNVAVFTAQDGQPVLQGARILEQSKTFFRDVMKLDSKYGVDNKIFEVEREGSTKDDTKYFILPEYDIDDTLRRKLAGLQLYDLAASATSENPVLVGEAGTPKAGGAEPAQLITTDEGDGLIEDLKILKEYRAEIVDDFLSEFKLRKIRELPASRLQAAKSWVSAELEGMRHSQQDGATGGAADPFA